MTNTSAYVRWLAAAVVGASSLTGVVAQSQAASAKKFKNCAALNQSYPHGVGRKGARDKTSGTPVTNYTVSSSLYAANRSKDRDKDGIACEKA
jgi:hypothetical protein